MKRRLVLVLLGAGLSMLVGCSSFGVSEPAESIPVTPDTTLGDAVLNACLKIKSTITDTSVNPSRTATVELYVDNEGDGQGLLGFGDILCDVKVVDDVLYVLVDDTTVVAVNNITGRLILTSTSLTGEGDLTSKGFILSDGNPVEYNAKQGTLVVNTRYAQSTAMLETARVATETVMSFEDMIEYVIDYNTDSQIPVDNTAENPEVTDFYLASKYGVQIEGSTYSIGDTCNVATYFNSLTPEGLLNSSEYKEDERVDFVHASYVSTTGRTVFVITSNYVQAIQSNADFSFLGLTKGMDAKALKAALGWKLSNRELEAFQPIDDKLEVTAFNHNIYYCTAGNLNVELRLDKSGLSEIYIEQRLDFKG